MTFVNNQSVGTAAVDVTGVFNSQYAQLFPQARAVKATVNRPAKMFSHPLEDGASRVDHKIFDPVEIELLVLLTGFDYKNTYRQIVTAFKSNELWTVQTRLDSYPNMTIAALPHEEVPDMLDVTAIAIRLQETQLFSAQFQALPPRAVERPRDASTAKRGEQNASEGGSKGSVAYRILYGSKK